MNNLILNRYKPIEEAGRGGFGTVVVAWDTRMRRKVAIKQISLSEKINMKKTSTITQIIDPNDPKKTKIINNKNIKKTTGKSIDAAGEHWEESVPGLIEARTAAMIQDANIVTVHDFELEGNNAYIIMEYIEGITLTQFLNQYSNQMTLDMLSCIFNGVAHALEVAHAENVLHLDIKPDNVLIDKKGKVKVTDFGLATLADEFGYGTANAGTLGYMAPEQMRRMALDQKTDEWALACLTYEMLCGKNPFEAKDLPSALRKTEDMKFVLPSSCWEDLNYEVDEICKKALSPNSNQRYESVKEFKKLLMQNLSNPRAGQKQLAALLTNRNDEVENQVNQNKKYRILEGLTNNIGQKILARVFSVCAIAPICILGCINIDFLGGKSPNIIGIICILSLFTISGIWPPLGLCCAIASFCFALILTGNYIASGVLLLISILWCIYNFKLKFANTNTTASFALFGTFGFSQFCPFITGLFNDIKDSVINCAYGFVLCLFLAALGSNTLIGWEPFKYAFFNEGISSYGLVQDSIIKLVLQTSTWIWAASWIATSAITSFCINRNQRAIKILGPIAGIIIMILGICLANYFSSGQISWQPQGWEILPTITGGIASIIIAIFLPNRNIEAT